MKDLVILENVGRSEVPLVSNTIVDEFTKVAQNCFDYQFVGESKYYPYNKPLNIPTDFNIGVIVGSSGSGKSTLLKEFGQEEHVTWDTQKGVISHFEEPQEAVKKLGAVGLNSVPTWVRPYSVLSTGEKFRADLAMRLKNNAVIDEFTSVVDRNVAKSCSVSINKYIHRNNIKQVVFATCHRDIIEWLQPCWVFDTDTGILYDGRSLRRPTINIGIYEAKYNAWEMFKKHHYLSEDINKASKNFIVKWGEEIVGFVSMLPSPNRYVKNSWRFHRLVVLPDYQGMGLGTSIANSIGEMWLNMGWRLFMKTAHVRLGNYMDTSNKWIPTAHNGKRRTIGEKMKVREKWHNYDLDTKRICYTYEYVGKDYLNKEHIRLGIKFESNVPWDNFKHTMDTIIDKYKDKYIVFVSTEVGRENLADTYAKSHSIRREHFGSKTKYDILLTF